MSRTTRAMTDATNRLQNINLNKNPQEVVDTVSEWVYALDTFITASRRVRNYVVDRDRDRSRGRIVYQAIEASALTLEGLASEESGVVLADLDTIIRVLDTRHPLYQRLERLHSELYRLMSEAKIVVARSVV